MQAYTALKTTAPIRIDGDLNKPAWAEAEEAVLLDSASGSAPEQGTRAKLRWDDLYLYASFRCEDREVHATYTAFNEPLYEEDVVELFVSHDGDLKRYLEFELNPLNAVLQYAIFNDLNGSIFPYARLDNRVISAVRRDDDRRITDYELAIPLTEFASAAHIPPRPGDEWRLNLYRIDRSPGRPSELTAWSPTGKPNFHLPAAFGRLIFAE
ncbi:carbohydrate-binding family 9-like protein [Cohnella nanjingensis]|uniref:Carbohydrate-binding family 9-like protein n=1 Tax=Cohnella nanjingensis TaxID=1387779 RepID=A0A7X0RPM1_9BACL|nr:carbohydrate-binding family 9-like protein [Cohnella nanjingensis]MBB6671382.1 carbohydrate-binding family 9-like protein [Cohnella nanjingensis]